MKGKYTWVKAPRFEGKPAQVGPLANVLVGYASGDPLMKKWTEQALSNVGAIAKIKVGPEVLHSTLGRHAARAVRTAVLAEVALDHWQKLLDNVLSGDKEIFNPPTFPKGRSKESGSTKRREARSRTGW
jgi:hydrogenase large subunit